MRTERPLFRALFHGRGFLTPNRESRQPPHTSRFPRKAPARVAGTGPARRNARASAVAREAATARAREAARHRVARRVARQRRRAALARRSSIPPEDTSGILPPPTVCVVNRPSRSIEDAV